MSFLQLFHLMSTVIWLAVENTDYQLLTFINKNWCPGGFSINVIKGDFLYTVIRFKGMTPPPDLFLSLRAAQL